MAELLAAIYGSRRDSVNCPFFFKIGACRFGDLCARAHTRPTEATVILLSQFYVNPYGNALPTDAVRNPSVQEQEEEFFRDFFEDVEHEFTKYGSVESIVVCDNVAEHLRGNLFVQYKDVTEATSALKNLNGRWFSGREVKAELTLVNDFREASCRMHDIGQCNRGGGCNFIHQKRLVPALRKVNIAASCTGGMSRSSALSRDYRLW